MSEAPTTVCPGCGLELERVEGPEHPHLGASAECWALYGELLAREFGAPEHPGTHRTCVDAYAVQHPGVPERRTIQSVGIHLMGLGLVFGRGLEPSRVNEVLGRRDIRMAGFRWLEPPKPNGRLTIDDVLASSDPADHFGRTMAWAEDVWRAWQPHHETVEGWLDRTIGRTA